MSINNIHSSRPSSPSALTVGAASASTQSTPPATVIALTAQRPSGWSVQARRQSRQTVVEEFPSPRDIRSQSIDAPRRAAVLPQSRLDTAPFAQVSVTAWSVPKVEGGSDNHSPVITFHIPEPLAQIPEVADAVSSPSQDRASLERHYQVFKAEQRLEKPQAKLAVLRQQLRSGCSAQETVDIAKMLYESAEFDFYLSREKARQLASRRNDLNFCMAKIDCSISALKIRENQCDNQLTTSTSEESMEIHRLGIERDKLQPKVDFSEALARPCRETKSDLKIQEDWVDYYSNYFLKMLKVQDKLKPLERFEQGEIGQFEAFNPSPGDLNAALHKLVSTEAHLHSD
jgi:hypothetical protein